MMRKSLRTILGCFMLAGAIAAAACSGGEAAPSTSPAGGGRGGGANAQAVPVTTAPVVKKSVPLSVQGIGTVIAASTVSVRAIPGSGEAGHRDQGTGRSNRRQRCRARRDRGARQGQRREREGPAAVRDNPSAA